MGEVQSVPYLLIVRFEESGAPRKVRPKKSLIMHQEKVPNDSEKYQALTTTINNLEQENKYLKERISFLSGETIGELDMNTLQDLDHKYRKLMVTISQRMKDLLETQSKCVICLEGKKEIALIPCGHKVFSR